MIPPPRDPAANEALLDAMQEQNNFLARRHADREALSRVAEDESLAAFKRDMVNHPPHYTTGKIEALDYIEDQRLGFHEGQVITYVSRARYRGSEMEDLRKAEFYLMRRITQLQQEAK